MENTMRKMYSDMADACEKVGMKIISDDHCCKLMAWLYCYGGANSDVIYNYKLNENIKIAQQRLNLSGGEIPNLRLFPTLKKYLAELQPHKTLRDGKQVMEYHHPLWVYEICDMYNVSRNCIR